jgi:hypothetical protein
MWQKFKEISALWEQCAGLDREEEDEELAALVAQGAQQLESKYAGKRHEISEVADRVIRQTQCKLRALAKKFPEFLTAKGELVPGASSIDAGAAASARHAAAAGEVTNVQVRASPTSNTLAKYFGQSCFTSHLVCARVQAVLSEDSTDPEMIKLRAEALSLYKANQEGASANAGSLGRQRKAERAAAAAATKVVPCPPLAAPVHIAALHAPPPGLC